jgi:hypothetical protein
MDELKKAFLRAVELEVPFPLIEDPKDNEFVFLQRLNREPRYETVYEHCLLDVQDSHDVPSFDYILE